MDSSQVHQLINKYSTLEVVKKATRILAVIENHIDNDNCEHCLELLKSAGFTPQPEHRTAATTFGTSKNGYREHSS